MNAPMIKLRLDVDYPYPSRAKSFLYLALRIKSKKSPDYLKNARVIARMINESPKEVRAFWFFTPYTIPDQKLLALLNPDKHEVALHVANKPLQEWKVLENQTNRKVTYYTMHGTQRVFARILWGRKLSQAQPEIPNDFPLTSFHQFHNLSLDRERYRLGFEAAVKGSNDWISNDIVLSIHPEWLFDKTERSQRGPFYDVLKTILEVDKNLETLRVRKKGFVKLASDIQEYEKNIQPTDQFTAKLRDKGIDIFTFLDRRWCCPITNPPANWIKEEDNVGLLEIKDYNSWWQAIGKKTRNMVRRAEKNGVKVAVVEPSDKLAESIWKIYNETPIRQERAFTHYSEPLNIVKGNMYAAKNNTFIAGYLGEEIVGFIQILYGDNIVIVSNILSLQSTGTNP
jgi:hypothetical protein